MAEKEDIKQSIEKVVEDILSKDTVEKAMPTSLPANGGKDEIRSGSPHSEKESMAGDKKKEEAKKAEECSDEEHEEKEEEKKKAKMKKAEDKEEDKDEKKEDDKEEKKSMYKKMKKSIEELSDLLDEEELELVKAWREDQAAEEAIAKSEPATKQDNDELVKSISKAFEAQLEPLKKALEDKETVIKSLSEKVEKMASQPAYDRRSISTLETLEKSGTATQDISKSQVLDKMLELQRAGKGVTSHHIGEFEATNNISNPTVKALVFKELKLN